jgi:hypothetical protein
MNLRILTLALLSCLLSLAGVAHADLQIFLSDLNLSARQDPGGFRAELGARFDVSGARLDLILRSVDSPAEAAVVLWLGEHSQQPPERVLRVYRERRGQGWGAVARGLGIKPGSADFHDLKAGEFGWHPTAGHGKGKDREHGKGRKSHK